MRVEIDVEAIKLGAVILAPVLVYAVGRFITYPPHAAAAAFSAFFLGMALYAFLKAEEKIGDEGE